MIKLLRSKLIIFVFIPLLAFQSCAGVKRPVTPASPAEPSTPVKESVKLEDENQARKHMEAGAYQEAIDIYSTECNRQPQDSGLMKEYAKGLDNIRSTADNALGKEDFEQAGRLYYVLQKNYVKFNNVNKMLSFDSGYLDTKLSSCVKSLSVKGFEEYRKGDINRALKLWQSVLAIDPDNKAIKDAVKTAKQQQKNLKEGN